MCVPLQWQGSVQSTAQSMSACVCQSKSVCMRVCLYLWLSVCVISSPKRQLHADFLNGESFSVMTTKWRACISNPFSPFLSTFPSLICCVFHFFLLVGDCTAISAYLLMSLLSSPHISTLSVLLPPSIFLFSLILLPPSLWITIACCCSEQNEMHLSQLNLWKMHKNLNNSRKTSWKKAGKKEVRMEESVKEKKRAGFFK